MEAGQRVMSPRFLSDLSYSGQLVTRYFRLYFGFLFRLCASFTVDSNGWRSLMGGSVYAREVPGMFMHQRRMNLKGTRKSNLRMKLLVILMMP